MRTKFDSLGPNIHKLGMTNENERKVLKLWQTRMKSDKRLEEEKQIWTEH